MLHELLKNYKKELLKSHTEETANTYYKRLSKLFEGQKLSDTVACLDVAKILDNLSQIKYKNYFSQSKNAFLKFCEFQNISLSAEALKSIAELEGRTKKKYRKLLTIEFEEIDTAIKNIKNAKLKLSYQVIIATGLRVSEIAQIRSIDCRVTDNTVAFSFVGKGGNAETVSMTKSENSKLFHRITEHIKITSADKKLFYSAVSLQVKAKELGFGCHDLRRAYAKLEYQKCGSKTCVKEKMRHSNLKNTSIYLNSKIKL